MLHARPPSEIGSPTLSKQLAQVKDSDTEGASEIEFRENLNKFIDKRLESVVSDNTSKSQTIVSLNIPISQTPATLKAANNLRRLLSKGSPGKQLRMKKVLSSAVNEEQAKTEKKEDIGIRFDQVQ